MKLEMNSISVHFVKIYRGEFVINLTEHKNLLSCKARECAYFFYAQN